MTLHLDDARWRAAVDAELRGEATEEQRALLDRYRPQSFEHQTERAFLSALASDPEVPETRPAWLDHTLETYDVDEPALGPKPRRALMRFGLALGLVAASASATYAAMQWARPHRAPPLAAHIPHLELPSRGSPSLCTSRTGASVCAEDGTRVTARGSGAVELHDGTVTVRTASTDDATVTMGAVSIRPAPHSVAVVERGTEGWSLVVESGTATVVEATTRRVGPGETLTSTPSVAEVSTLLAQARTQRRDGDSRGAIATYGTLIEAYPRSVAAQAAQVSLGQLLLEQGEPKDALQQFRAYARHGGPLLEEAAYGEIRALEDLGETSAARRATRAFQRQFPSSSHRADLRP